MYRLNRSITKGDRKPSGSSRIASADRVAPVENVRTSSAFDMPVPFETHQVPMSRHTARHGEKNVESQNECEAKRLMRSDERFDDEELTREPDAIGEHGGDRVVAEALCVTRSSRPRLADLLADQKTSPQNPLAHLDLCGTRMMKSHSSRRSLYLPCATNRPPIRTQSVSAHQPMSRTA